MRCYYWEHLKEPIDNWGTLWDIMGTHWELEEHCGHYGNTMRTYWELIAYPYSLKLPYMVENRVYRLCMRHNDLCLVIYSLIYSKPIQGTTTKKKKKKTIIFCPILLQFGVANKLFYFILFYFLNIPKAYVTVVTPMKPLMVYKNNSPKKIN